jgi:hypothetical protein
MKIIDDYLDRNVAVDMVRKLSEEDPEGEYGYEEMDHFYDRYYVYNNNPSEERIARYITKIENYLQKIKKEIGHESE